MFEKYKGFWKSKCLDSLRLQDQLDDPYLPSLTFKPPPNFQEYRTILRKSEVTIFRSSRSQMLFQIGALKNVANFLTKTPLLEAQRYWKRDCKEFMASVFSEMKITHSLNWKKHVFMNELVPLKEKREVFIFYTYFNF